MLIPFANTKFANISSKDFYARSKELKDSKFNGCLSITYPDHEGVIFYSEGEPVTAMQEYNRWITLGEELIEPIENKALNSDGTMTAFELPLGFLHIFIHKHVESTVNGELGSYLSVRTLAKNFENEHSTCIIKVRDKQSRGYVFINFGKQVGAALESAKGKTYDDIAMKEMDQLQGKARVSVFFLELSQAYIKSPPSQPVPHEGPAIATEATRPPEAMPTGGHMPSPAESIKSITYVLSKPAPAAMAAAAPSHLKLILVMSDDRFVGLQHRSKLMTLEALNEENVAWVDRKTLQSLNMKGDRKANLILAGGNEYPVMLREVEIIPDESKFIILPYKLRKRLAVSKGAMIGIKA